MSIRHYHSAVLYAGAVLPGVSVTVKVAGTSTLASLYSDAAGATPLANPFTNDATYGTVDFYAEEGTYDITLSKLGYTFPPLDNILVGAPAFLTNTVPVPTVNGAPTLSASNAIPAGASDVKVFVKNMSDFGSTGGLTGYDVGDGTVQDRWGTAIPLTLDHLTEQADFRAYDPGVVYTSATSVILSALGGLFDANGAATVTVKYRKDTP